MRVQHNIMAMNAYRNYNTNNSALSKNLEKLSSGYAINRAGDDAAGLAISEKMRAQITGLDVAQDNAQDGVSLVQTAEGALTEVHDMLNRMYELANKSANGTYEESDRNEISKEIQELSDEIDRISNTTNFNGIKLLDGSLSSVGKIDLTFGTAKLTATAGADASKITIQAANSLTGGNFTVSIASATGDITVKLGSKTAGGTYTTEDIAAKIREEAQKIIDAKIAASTVATDAVYALKNFKLEGADSVVVSTGASTTTNQQTFAATDSNLKLQIGDTGDKDNQLVVSVGDCSSAALGVNGVAFSVKDQDGAVAALKTIKSAIETVSGVRGTLGATQNRLEHTMNNLSVTEENIQNAESAIRDTDVADEMMAYTKNNILIQSAQAMLAQANQVPQGVLQLLQ